MEWKNKKVLVTGAEGFIGSHLTETLLRKGAIVTAMVKGNFLQNEGFIEEFEPSIKKNLNVYFGELTDIESVKNAMKGSEIVFHLGAEISIPYSYLHPRTFVSTNIIGTLNVLLTAKELGVKRLVNMSSSEVYGTPDSVPITEKHTLKGQSPYSATKIGAEKLAESFFLSYGLPVTTVRAFNTYGPRQSARAIIPTLITQALFKDKILMGNTKPTRDFNYVGDTVHGLIKVAECDALIGHFVNIGTGKEISMGELVNKIVMLTNSSAKIVIDKKRLRPEKSEVMRLCADNSKIKKYTDWDSKTSFEDGLKRTIDWIRKNAHFYKVGKYQI